MLPVARQISLLPKRLCKTFELFIISQRNVGVQLGSPYPLRDAEIPNADLQNDALKIDLPIVKHLKPRREFDAFREQVAWHSDGIKDKLYKHVELELRGHDASVMRSYQSFLREAARHLDIEVSRVFDGVPTHEHQTTMKSAFVYKKHQVQYEWRTFFKHVQLRHLTESTANTYLEYVQRNLPEGVSMNVAYLEMRAMPDYLRHPPSVADEQERLSADSPDTLGLESVEVKV